MPILVICLLIVLALVVAAALIVPPIAEQSMNRVRARPPYAPRADAARTAPAAGGG